MEQTKEWAGDFGQEYTDRNAITIKEMNNLYKQQYGISRSELNALFLGRLNHSIKILEIGANIGNQLLCLQKLGFTNLYGIELQRYAILQSKAKDICLMQGSAYNIPFKDNQFDLVFTSGLLIHISPENVTRVLEEIYRCTNSYILGLEYFAKQPTEITYRGHSNLLWKADFARLYMKHFQDLNLIREKELNYLDNHNVDSMFLLRKIK